MDAVARPPLETLARSAGGTLLVLRPFFGTFPRIPCPRRTVQCRRIEKRLKFLGSDFSKLSDARYQGWFVGAGVAYGYAWILGRHWNLELEIGVGYAYTQYDKFRCAGCGKKVESDKSHHYVGPTKAAVNLVYVF